MLRGRSPVWLKDAIAADGNLEGISPDSELGGSNPLREATTCPDFLL
jgi:hypothetical protein